MNNINLEWHRSNSGVGYFIAEDKPEASSAITFLPVNVTTPQAPNLALQVNDHLRIEIPIGFEPVALKQAAGVLLIPLFKYRQFTRQGFAAGTGDYHRR